ncbi:NAD-dependent epimerase/dehydratase family protein [Pseudodesulfovibrio portus]|uniref:NAD-dependent epimerase n=1 Tax=Pseudodesulfovibrio portus TaxID=231439 RepID=A0ABM8AT99_9BACT|nr:NAD-dependent epimerase/dehydratase family protein [Pseudodesulfovibrio portus]BDQ34689.1 NAD-dependent epimerase [Pseudodesulfovibrio portus]
MSVCLVTGSGGLIGGETARFFASKGFDVVGVDNDMRSYFFGRQASTRWHVAKLSEGLPSYTHYAEDIRDPEAMDRVFARHGKDIAIVVHTAAQPSHDWAAREPLTDFDVNARATLILLEAVRKHCPEAVFIFTSTNKVYGDTPNALPLVETETRYELDESHPWHAQGIDETMSLDASTHSVFGASKVAADIMVQEYGRYFGMNTVVFRGGCLTGSGHSGAELHGFLAYLVKCGATGAPYTVFGYKGKQVRDNIHSSDLVNMFWHYFNAPRPGQVYNAGGGRHSNCSMLEAIALCEEITGREFNYTYADDNRVGDHMWWISDVSKFREHYPRWQYTYGIRDIVTEIYENTGERMSR